MFGPFLFVYPRPGPCSLAETLGKVVVDNFLECYHCLIAHPAFNASTNLILPIDEHQCLAVYEFVFSLVESVQRGLRLGFYHQGQLILSHESRIQHFQKLVYSVLTEGPDNAEGTRT